MKPRLTPATVASLPASHPPPRKGSPCALPCLVHVIILVFHLLSTHTPNYTPIHDTHFVHFPPSSSPQELAATPQLPFESTTPPPLTPGLPPTHSLATTMSTLSTRQSDGNLGMDNSYDYYDSHNCYEEGRCSWWWSDVRPFPPNKQTPSYPSLLSKKLTPSLPPDRLSSPLHHRRHPLHAPLRLLPRRLLARAAPRAQKPPAPSLPPLDGQAPHNPLPALLGQRSAHVPQRVWPTVLRAPSAWSPAASGLLRHAEQFARAPASGLSCGRCAAAGLSASAGRE